MTQPQIEYQVYLQELEESGKIVVYDQDERPVYVTRIQGDDNPLSFTEWMKQEMIKAIEEEDYEYAAQIRDEYKNNNTWHDA
jgi:protein-arginine kinase activator protein McsA